MSWNKIDKLATAYMKAPGESAAISLDNCLKKTQDSLQTFALYFIRPLVGMGEANAAFLLSENGTYPEWACQYDEETATFKINPIGVLAFRDECEEAGSLVKTQEGRGDFKKYRLLAYLTELNKLPLKYLFFLSLFREVARVMEITRADKRRTANNPPSPDEEAYLSYLWAFKELEEAMKKIAKIDIRVDYQISWYASDWTTINTTN
ncbi:MAG: hypothetical protein GX561_12235 [Lentisphaerae bacterium]|jgi:hypothetical protein|nr:hypothetical protein [Lentisphaerota bacterium]